MKSPEQITAMVISNGLDVALATKLSETYKRVFFHVPREDEFPKINDAMIGVGMGKIEILPDMWGPGFDDTDLFVFPDLGYGELQLRLESDGHKVWGARRGEEMELDREAMKKHLASIGLPVGKWESIKGFDALRAHLQKHENVFVKVSRYRGSWETIFSESYDLIKPELDEAEMQLSGISEQIEFVVEEKLDDKVEMATDGWCIDGHFSSQTLVGIEEKDCLYIGRFMPWSDVPKPLQMLNKKLSPTLGQYGYRGFWSPESMIGSDGKAYLNDPCTRIPSPPGALYLEFFQNIAEIIWAGANGEIVEPMAVAEYGIELVLKSEWGREHWNTISFPEKYSSNIKLREVCKVDGVLQSIPQGIASEYPGSIIGWGDSIEAAETMVREVAEAVKATQLKIPLEAFDKIRVTLDKADQMGIGIT